ncbi:MAG: DUF6455 family protein [Gammaproteobacteria bacterium]|nr:DUF6455 family protein [Gammaproteobacteria bacterium]
MEYASIAAVAIYSILFVAMVVIILTTIIFNIKAGVKYRKNIARQLDQLRMSKMLRALGIDTTQYLHQERISEINMQMNRCNECQNTDQCDEDMATGNIDPGNISYCNNEESLKAIAEKQKQVD